MMIEMVEIDGVFFNPDRVAYITDYFKDKVAISGKCLVFFSGHDDDFHRLNVPKNLARTKLEEKKK